MLACWDLSPTAAPGVGGVTWASYGQDLVASLRDLHARAQSGRYRASPSRRAYIPKADGRQRPLGIAALQDKIVQRAVTGVLHAIYEADFRGLSYGFRPRRGCPARQSGYPAPDTRADRRRHLDRRGREQRLLITAHAEVPQIMPCNLQPVTTAPETADH